MKNILVLFGSALTCSLAVGQDVQAAADDVCGCLEEPYALLEKAVGDFAVAQAHGDHATLLEKQEEMTVVMEATETCFEGLEEKYPEIDKNAAMQDEVMALAEKQCPNPVGNFNFGN